MPIVTVLIPGPAPELRTEPAAVFAEAADVGVDLVTVNVVSGSAQSGNAYRAVVEVVVPDLWTAEERRGFLDAVGEMLEHCWGIERADAIAWVRTIPSGSVVDRGKLGEW
jgi:hypothetical protein